MIEIGRSFHVERVNGVVLRFFYPRPGHIQAPWVAQEDIFRACGLSEKSTAGMAGLYRKRFAGIYRTVFDGRERLTLANTPCSIELVDLWHEGQRISAARSEELRRAIYRSQQVRLIELFGHLPGSFADQPEVIAHYQAVKADEAMSPNIRSGANVFDALLSTVPVGLEDWAG